MSRARSLVAGGLTSGGALALIAFAASTTLGALGLWGLSPTPGVYEVLVALAGVALLLRGLSLRRAEVWEPFAAWWAGADRGAMLGRLAALGGELTLLFLLIRVFRIENPAFQGLIAPLIIAGAVLNALVPRAWRLRYFLLLSLAAIWLAFGFPDAPFLVAVVLAVIVACHLPLPFWARVTVVLALGALLAAARVQLFEVPWSRAVWPILGSILMFRTIVYLYDLRHLKVPPTWSERLSYFLLLPNVAFPLFPVVDFAAFRRTYYDAESTRIVQRGVEWMLRGILQLILYRLIYQFLMIPQGDVRTWPDVMRFIVSNFLLYVRVSGQFHLIVGSLHLFGFHLPETHRRPFIASSFTDFWRRINIYWKDFMTKVFYYPLHFRLRKFGERQAMVVATLAVFVMTWALHSYQWFWLLGSFPVTATDTLFWGTLAVLLVVNSLREASRGRTRSLTRRGPSRGEMAKRTLGVAGTFVSICLLWSLWMSPTFADWLALWSVEGWSLSSTLGGAPVLIAAVLLTAAILVPLSGSAGGLRAAKGDYPFARGAMGAGALMAGALVLSASPVRARFGESTASVIASLQDPQLNKRDLTQLQRGYYEDLMGVSRFNSQLWEIYMQKPPAAEWPRLDDTPAARHTGDFLRLALVPGARINFLGSTLTVNSLGMRDKEYAAARPAGTQRIALMGASVEMGWGVGDGESFEALVERALDRTEVMNFAVSAYTMPQQLVALDHVLSFDPDVVLLVAHEIDANNIVNRMMESEPDSLRFPFDTLAREVTAAGLGSLPKAEVRKRLEAHQEEYLAWTYREFAARVRAHGALPLWVFVPLPDRDRSAEAPRLAASARAAGFETIDLSDAFAGLDRTTLQLTKWDYHPNTKGHQVIAEHLETALRANPLLLSHRAPGH